MSNKVDAKNMKKIKREIKPQLRFPEFKDAGEWLYPHGSELFQQISNKQHDSSLPVLAITQEYGAIPREAIDYQVFVSEKSLESYKVVDVDDFIISLRTFQGGIEHSLYRGICSPAYVVLRKKTDSSVVYFKYFFKTQRFINELNRNIEGLRDGKMVTYKQFSEICLPIPRQIDEQQKIADCLSSIDESITTQTQKLDTLKSHKKGLMQQLFPAEGESVPRLRFPKFQDAGEWESKLLGEVADNLDNQRVPITEKNRTKGLIPYYGASGIVDYVRDFIFDEDLLCISEDGANLLARTSPIAFSISGKSWVNNHAHVLRFKHQFTQVLVENYLNSIKLDDYLTGMAQPKLNKAMLDSIPVPLPLEINEQQKIADCLSSLDDLITTQAQKVEALKAHKKGLTQQLFPQAEEERS